MPTDNSTPPIQKDVVDENEGEDSSETKIEHEKVDEAEKHKEKNLEVTIPFTDLISQVRVYAKFLKDMVTKKNDFSGINRVALTGECSAILQNKIPSKLNDPGSFSIPCHVGALFIDKALCDLGASVSVMSLSICNKPNLGVLKCTQITLQMTHHFVKYPLGILEDVPLRVEKFYIPVDFVVLDMEEDSQISIILCRPFLCTAGAVIDVKYASLTLCVGDDTVNFKLTNVIKSATVEHTCCRINVLDKISGGFQQFLSDDFSETTLDLDDLDNVEVEDYKVMKTIYPTHEPYVKKLRLKPLPSHLKYAFLDDNEECPVIVSTKLTTSQLSQLHIVRRMHKKAIECNIDDLNVKGVRSFLGHVGFHRRFINDFSKIAKPLTQLLLKDVTFDLTDAYVESFDKIKEAFVTTPIIQPPYRSLPFEIMCVASDYAVGVVLGQ
ncbi:uncharacterized protein LOC104907488 [Beta vulgaris subsp. vulgaris]|uniref:uncharacterized protein LOC104907488 n=1 Tax=Beta vulgaris subsp. vulgaris TaxID=3555 RepID=UPI00053FCCC8|nr:uncharacterized protein LOC104907488 [Beta vulgaris subsp. vulgaris]